MDEVTSAHDTDTVTLRGGTGDKGRFRLVGLDAVETSQFPAASKRGTAAIKQMLLGRQIEVQPIASKSHGREAGRLLTLDGVNVGVEMIRQGNGLAIRKSRTPGFNSQSDPAAYLAERFARAKAQADLKAGKELTVAEHGMWADPDAHAKLEERSKQGFGVRVYDFFRSLAPGVSVPKFDVDGNPKGMADLIDDATVGVIEDYNPEQGTVTLVSPGGKRKGPMLLTDLAGGMGLVQLLTGYDTPRKFDDKRRGR